MSNFELYQDLNEIIDAYQFVGETDSEDYKLDASDLYKMLVKIQSNWSSIVSN